jgi:hypothetical protein
MRGRAGEGDDSTAPVRFSVLGASGETERVEIWSKICLHGISGDRWGVDGSRFVPRACGQGVSEILQLSQRFVEFMRLRLTRGVVKTRCPTGRMGPAQ